MFPLREVNSKHHNDHISEAIATLQRNTINHRLHAKPQHRRETGQGVANRRTGLARSCRHCYLLRSASQPVNGPTRVAVVPPQRLHAARNTLPAHHGLDVGHCVAQLHGREVVQGRPGGQVGRQNAVQQVDSLCLSLCWRRGWGWRRRCWLQGTGAEGVAVFGGPGLADLLELR
jgi:hypothetical protein